MDYEWGGVGEYMDDGDEKSQAEEAVAWRSHVRCHVQVGLRRS